MIHGGVRYLESYEFGLVREALRERRILLNLAPHLVRAIPFMVPVYKKSGFSRLKVDAGMLLYDILSWDKNWKVRPDKQMPWRSSMGSKEALELEPALSPEQLTGAALYYDGQVPSPARLTVEFALSAAANGAALANRAEVVGLRMESGSVTGVEVKDRLGGRELVIKTRLAINAAGLWATRVMEMLASRPPVNLAPSKGIHIITRPLLRTHAGVFLTSGGRRLMIIPWHGKSLIGTTDVFYTGDIERVRPTQDEVAAMVSEVNEVLPSAKLEVEGGPALLRGVSTADRQGGGLLVGPLPPLGDPRPRPARPPRAALRWWGEKLTTSRSVAKHVVDRVESQIGKGGKSPTARLPIGGGDIGPLEGEVSKLAADFKLQPEVATELVHSYGSAAQGLVQAGQGDPGQLERIPPGHAVPAGPRSDTAVTRKEMAHDVVGCGAAEDRPGQPGRHRRRGR